MSTIEAQTLCKSYGQRRAVWNLKLDVQGGELVALVGENGAGKTTALGMLSGQLVPDAGQALIGGHDVFADALRARTQLGFVGQDLLLPQHLTIAELAEFVCTVKGCPYEKGELDRLAALTRLDDDVDRLVGELSFGMQRKAAWVTALIAHPAALLLDEGLAGLDATSAAAIIEEVDRQLERGAAVLWTEHDLAPIIASLSRLVVLQQGRTSETVEGVEVRRRAERGQLQASMRDWTSS